MNSKFNEEIGSFLFINWHQNSTFPNSKPHISCIRRFSVIFSVRCFSNFVGYFLPYVRKIFAGWPFFRRENLCKTNLIFINNMAMTWPKGLSSQSNHEINAKILFKARIFAFKKRPSRAKWRSLVQKACVSRAGSAKLAWCSSFAKWSSYPIFVDVERERDCICENKKKKYFSIFLCFLIFVTFIRRLWGYSLWESLRRGCEVIDLKPTICQQGQNRKHNVGRRGNPTRTI